MKKILAHHIYYIVAALSLSGGHATAGFVSPIIPAQDSVPPTTVQPAGGSSRWTVSNDHDDGPGSLRHAIVNAAPGDTIQFALHPHSLIELRSTLVIDKDLTILGTDPKKLLVARSFRKRTPSFRVFTVNAGTVTLAGMTILNGRG